MKRPRWREQFKAWLLGYYWLPCPICGTHYGGHEKPKGTLLLEQGYTRSTCPQCLGYWAKVNGRPVELKPSHGEDNELYVAHIVGSSEWAEGVQ